jgi:hypothetical protein
MAVQNAALKLERSFLSEKVFIQWEVSLSKKWRLIDHSGHATIEKHQSEVQGDRGKSLRGMG